MPVIGARKNAGDGAGKRWIVDTDLQRPLAHPHAAHRDRKRLEFRLAKKKHAILLMI